MMKPGVTANDDGTSKCGGCLTFLRNMVRKKVDTNGDGVIQPEEVTAAVGEAVEIVNDVTKAKPK
jgi:hypothetical protein